MCSWNWEKLKTVIRIKKNGFCIFHCMFPLEYAYTHSISLMRWESNFKQKISTRVIQKKIKMSWKEYVKWRCFKFWPMKNIFWKQKSQQEFGYGLFIKLPRITATHNFSSSSFKFQSYPTSLDKISTLTWRILAV